MIRYYNYNELLKQDLSILKASFTKCLADYDINHALKLAFILNKLENNKDSAKRILNLYAEISPELDFCSQLFSDLDNDEANIYKHKVSIGKLIGLKACMDKDSSRQSLLTENKKEIVFAGKSYPSSAVINARHLINERDLATLIECPTDQGSDEKNLGLRLLLIARELEVYGNQNAITHQNKLDELQVINFKLKDLIVTAWQKSNSEHTEDFLNHRVGHCFDFSLLRLEQSFDGYCTALGRKILCKSVKNLNKNNILGEMGLINSCLNIRNYVYYIDPSGIVRSENIKLLSQKYKKIIFIRFPPATLGFGCFQSKAEKNNPKRYPISKIALQTSKVISSYILELIQRHTSESLPVVIYQDFSWKGFSIQPSINNAITYSHHTAQYYKKTLPSSGEFIHYKQGHFYNIIVEDKSGYAGFSNPAWCHKDKLTKTIDSMDYNYLTSSLNRYKNVFFRRENTWQNQKDDPGVIQALKKIKANNKIIGFFPLQVPVDEVAQLSYLSMKEIINCLKIAHDLYEYGFVIKLHPADTTLLYRSIIEPLKAFANILISDASIHDLIRHTDFTMTVNSGTGFEALMGNKPVITLGDCDYRIATTNCKNRQELLSTLKTKTFMDKNIYVDSFLYNYFSNNFISTI